VLVLVGEPELATASAIRRLYLAAGIPDPMEGDRRWALTEATLEALNEELRIPINWSATRYSICAAGCCPIDPLNRAVKGLKLVTMRRSLLNLVARRLPGFVQKYKTHHNQSFVVGDMVKQRRHNGIVCPRRAYFGVRR